VQPIVETFPVGPLGCNCTVIGDPGSKEAIVVDPGDDAARVAAILRRHDLAAKAIVHTHTHIDHVGATADVQRDTDAPALLHEADLFLYEMLAVQAAMLGMRVPRTVTVDRFLRDGDVVRAGGIELGVVHTPGHTPGSLTFVAAGHGLVLAGDTLFAGSVGRTDLWGGDTEALVRSIRSRIFSLPDETRVICGHGPDTTVGVEKRTNPFVGAGARHFG
jgi:glyoxylase-like metal-dependent hydrolase (beta-lactamase superfamily II)